MDDSILRKENHSSLNKFNLKPFEKAFADDPNFIARTDQQKRGSILLGVDSLKIKQLKTMDEIGEEGEPDSAAASIKSAPCSTETKTWKRRSLKRRFLDGLQEAVLASKSVVINVQRLFASDQALNAERQRQLDINRYAIHPMSKLRAYWDAVIVVVLTASFICLPVQLAFYVHDLTDPAWVSFNLIVDIIFLFDIFLNFQTGYLIPATDEIVLERRKIVTNYLTSWFILDLVSSIPFDYVWHLATASSSTIKDSDGDQDVVQDSSFLTLRLIKLLSLLRIFRMARLWRYISKLEEGLNWNVNTNVVSMLNLVLLMLLFTHWDACIQYFVPLFMQFPENSWVVRYRLHEPGVTAWKKYTFCVLRAVAHIFSIDYGMEEVPKTYADMFTIIFSMATGVSLFMMIVAHMSGVVMVAVDGSSAVAYAKRVAQVREYMRFRRLPADLQKKVLSYYEFRYQRKYFDEQNILHWRHLSYPLRKEILLHNCSKLVEKVPLFQDAPSEFLVDLCICLQRQVYLIGEHIVQAGRKGDEMYFIDFGLVEVQLPDGTLVSTLGNGSYFGEIALLFEEKRVATVSAIDISEVYILRKFDFDNVIKDYPEMKRRIQRMAKDRLDSVQKITGADPFKYIEDYANNATVEWDTKSGKDFQKEQSSHEWDSKSQ